MIYEQEFNVTPEEIKQEIQHIQSEKDWSEETRYKIYTRPRLKDVDNSGYQQPVDN